MGWLELALEGPETRRIFAIASAIGAFAIIQALYGLKSGSLGLIADAIHMCFHCVALLVSLIGMVAAANRSAHVSFAYSYGYDRHEVLASFSNALFLIFVACFIIAGAVGRLFQPALVEQSAYIFEFGVVGLGINIAGLALLGPGRSLEDHVKRYTRGQKLGAAAAAAGGGGGVLPTHSTQGGGGGRVTVSSAHASNVDAVRLNFLSHTVSSFAVVVSSLFVRYAGWLAADTLQSLFGAAFTLILAVPLARTTGLMLLQTVPDTERAALERCRRDAMTVPGLLEISNEHFWAQAPGFLVGSLVVRARAGAPHAEVLERVSAIYRRVCEDLTVEVVIDSQQLSWLAAAGNSAAGAAVGGAIAAAAGGDAGLGAKAGAAAGAGVATTAGGSSAHSWQQLPPLTAAPPVALTASSFALPVLPSSGISSAALRTVPSASGAAASVTGASTLQPLYPQSLLTGGAGGSGGPAHAAHGAGSDSADHGHSAAMSQASVLPSDLNQRHSHSHNGEEHGHAH